MDFTEQQIEDRYNKIPESIKEAITSAETAEMLAKIGDEHDLLLDDIDELTSQTGLVMLGLVHPNDYIKNLEKNLDLEREEAMALAKDVNARIFNPIRESLMKIHEPKSVLDNSGEDDSNQSDNREKIDRETILNEIESPPPAQIKTVLQENIAPTVVVPTTTKPKTEIPSINKLDHPQKPQIPTTETEKEVLNNIPIQPTTTPGFTPPVKNRILKEKLSGIVHVAKEESELNENSKSIKNISKGRQDPYREPIE